MFDPVTAIVGGSLLTAGAGIYSAKKSAGAVSDAASESSAVQKYMYDESVRRFDPYYQYGLSALDPLSAYSGVDYTAPTGGLRGTTDRTGMTRGDRSGAVARPMPVPISGRDPGSIAPSYEDTVFGPMEDWQFEQSPAYRAKYALGMEELNKQLQARGLAPSGVGANRAADLSRRLTSEDYNSERAYRLGQLTDLYTGKYSEYTDRYNKLLDAVKIGTGAASSIGQAGNVYGTQIGQSTMAAGEAEAGFYAGLPQAVLAPVNTGLRTYDYGKNAGWWGTPSGAPKDSLGAMDAFYTV